MKLEWLEDLLAVIETGSLHQASKKRFVTQPAFSRRIQSIERYIGGDLFDRSRKPLQLNKSVVDNEANIRQLVLSLRQLSQDLRQTDDVKPPLVLGCQHSISTAVAPALVKALSDSADSRIRIRSANRDESYSLLLTGEVDILLMYRLENESQDYRSDFLESRLIGNDALIPVIANDSLAHAAINDQDSKLNIIGYPENVFLGRVFNQTIIPVVSETHDIRWIAETGLTPAALQFALSGVGIAWVPRSLAKGALDTGNLVDLSNRLPSGPLEIHALRSKKEADTSVAGAWQWILSNGLPISNSNRKIEA